MLPIDNFLPEIHDKLSSGNNLVLQAEPGAGKSTALPLSLLNSPWRQNKKILMLEPRRLAAKSIAHYLAKTLGEKVGETVGYQIKNDRKITKDTVLEIVTEGILTRRLQSDPEISNIGLVIFDEFHERSIHADLSLLLSLEIQQTLREDLKLLVMSATIDTGLIANYMGGAAVIECPGRAFPVSVEYFPLRKEYLNRQVTSALRSVLGSTNGNDDILVFLPGQSDINKCITEAKKAFGGNENLLFLPLFGGLSLSQQEQAITPDPNGKRRIVFTTNIAETSLTIDGVSCVIDSGLEKVLVYDPTSGMTRFETTYISKASAEQRKGRAGRTQAGSCIRLWDETKQRSLRDYQEEEILSADLSGLILELKIWGAGEYDDINWLTPPPPPHFNSALSILTSLGLIDSNNKVTALGKHAAGIGLDPRLATLLLQANKTDEQGIACELAALLSDRDIFYYNNGVDIVTRLLALQDYKINRHSAMQSHPIRQASVEQLLSTASSLRKSIKIKPATTPYSLPQLQNTIGNLLLRAYPDRLAKKRGNSGNRYQLANGRGVFLFDGDPLIGSEWLIVVDCDAQKKEGRIFTAVSVTYDTIFACLSTHIVEKEIYGFDSTKGKITGRRVTKFESLTLKSATISNIPSDNFQECLHQVLKTAEGLELLRWTPQCETWLARARWLGKHSNKFPTLSKDMLSQTVEEWLLPYLSRINSITELKKVKLLELLESILSWDQQQFMNTEAPTEYTAPSQKTFPIIYDSQQGPTVSVQLQELFGEVDSPKIGGGVVPIRFELLSPARRPIQTTSDLANFWNTSYFEVAKEMRGRYPKHRWPEQPLLEKAGKSIKTKRR